MMRWPFLRVKVAERSMEPALRPGDWLLVRRTCRVRPGQIVLARHPGQPGMLIVKRAARRVEGDGEVGGGTAGGSGGPAPRASTVIPQRPAASSTSRASSCSAGVPASAGNRNSAGTSMS